jgi:hypothetical protein
VRPFDYATDRIRPGIAPAGRSVMDGWVAISAGTSSNRQRRAIVASRSVTSIIANDAPMHFRDPRPNGMKAPRGSRFSRPSIQR